MPVTRPWNIARILQSGAPLLDREFDDLFPLAVRRVSRVHWTPVEVAMRAARLLGNRAGANILDVGAGAGKFCIVAAATVGARVRGVEHRRHLVDIARTAASKVGVDVDFVHGTLEDEDASEVDGVYLFNPFAENISSPRDRLDKTVELSLDRFWRDVATTERFLRAARPGTRVVTYCGFGGSMPEDYVLAHREQHSSTLELWIKRDRLASARSDCVEDTRLGRTTLRALRDRALGGEGATASDAEPTSLRHRDQ